MEMDEYDGKMLTAEEIKQAKLRAIRSYFEEHERSTIVSFGRAGSRVIKSMLPIESDKTQLKMVVQDTSTVVALTPKAKKNLKKILKRSSYAEVDLEEQPSSSHSPVGTSLVVETMQSRVNKFSVSYDQFLSSPKLAANEVLSQVGKSSVYILVSGFGGTFGQTMHTEFALMLNKRRMPHMNIVILPAKTEKERRSRALRGLTELMKVDMNVKVYDNQDYIDSRRMFDPLYSSQIINRINEKIGLDIIHYNLRLTDSMGILKGGL